jgi:integrase
MRRSEVAQLRRGDIDFERMIIRIPKTKNRELNVPFPLHPELNQVFVDWHVPEMTPEERLAPYHVDAISRMFRRALLKAGLEGKKSPVHIMRHTYVTRILKETTNLFLAQKAARHQSVNATKRYEHIDLDDVSQDLAEVNF